MKRLLWLDIAKGVAILWVVYFHFFNTCFEHGTPPADDWSGPIASAATVLTLAWIKVSGLGFHAVGAFLILSGWALMASTTRRAAAGPVSWGAWYRARALRLYPMYWVAHLVYLLSPMVARLEPVDSRIVLSLLGLRTVDITMNFMYLNAAWWYFSMLIQFCAIFPLLFGAARRLGPWPFLLAACTLGFAVRYVMLIAYPQDGLWTQGGFALCRLPEFTLGMAMGAWHGRWPERMERFLLHGQGLAAGVLVYPAALWLYGSSLGYVFVDFATGVCCLLVVVGVAGIVSRLPGPARVIGLVGTFSYGTYLVHQPYVIWLGLRVREQPIWLFLLIAAATLAIMSVWGGLLERSTNALVDRLFPARTSARA